MHNTLLSQYNSNCHNLVRTTPLKSNTDSVRRTRKPATASGSRTAPIQTPNSTSPLLGTSSSQLQLYAATANPRPGSTAPTFKRSRVFPVSLVSSAPTPLLSSACLYRLPAPGWPSRSGSTHLRTRAAGLAQHLRRAGPIATCSPILYLYHIAPFCVISISTSSLPSSYAGARGSKRMSSPSRRTWRAS